MYLYRDWQSSIVAQAFIFPSNATTVTFLLSNILYVSKKALILLIVWTGTSVISLYPEQIGSFSGTPISLSSTSPVSIILMTPNTLTSTNIREGILMLEMIIMSRGSLSNPIVFGKNPQLIGKATGVARTRSSLKSPDSSSSSNFPFCPSGISTTAFTVTGELTLSSTPCRGWLTQRGFYIVRPYLSGCVWWFRCDRVQTTRMAMTLRDILINRIIMNFTNIVQVQKFAYSCRSRKLQILLDITLEDHQYCSQK